MFRRWLKAPSSSPRGSTIDRRQQRRINLSFDCTFLSAWATAEARISSLSPHGCFIETRSMVPAHGTILEDITVSLPMGPLTLQGQVLNPVRGVGFAVRFIGLDPETRKTLAALVPADRSGPIDTV